MTVNYRLHLQGQPDLPIDRILVVGRSKEADLVLDDQSVSRVHCRIVPYGNQLFLEDVSANGTLVNGAAVEQSSRLKANDAITLGSYTLQIIGVDHGPESDGPLSGYTIPPGVLTAAVDDRPPVQGSPVDLELVRLVHQPTVGALDATAFQDCIRVAERAVVFASGNLGSLDRRDEILSELHQALRGAADLDPAQALGQLNQTLIQHKIRASAVCARLELQQRRLLYASAAHFSPFVLRGTGKVMRVPEQPSLELGQMARARFQTEQFQMSPSETVVLVSAGLPALVGNDDVDAGLERIRQAVAGQPTTVKAVAARLTVLLKQHAAGIAPPPHSCAVCFGLG